MKTNPNTFRLGKFGFVCLVLVAMTAFDSWAVAYCYRHRDKSTSPQNPALQAAADYCYAADWNRHLKMGR